MPSRRTFMKTLGVGGAGVLGVPLLDAPLLAAPPLAAPRGELAHEAVARLRRLAPRAIKLDSNENPLGPGAAALERLGAAVGEASRYPFEAADLVRAALATSLGTTPEGVVLGCGSSEVLRMAVLANCGARRGLVTASPSFEDPVEHAGRLGAPVRAVPVTADLAVDLDGMRRAAPGAGLVFLCNPNNPTGGVHGADAVAAFVRDVLRAAPEATVLIDEAYHEYVDDPGYASALPLALEHPRVLVSRTFSKAHGMAGLRLGYAVGRPETVGRLESHRLGINVNALAAAAALGSLADPARVDAERARNREAREYTRGWFERAGYPTAPAAANFLMVRTDRPATAFQEAAAARGVLVGRPFPPLAERWARVSIGTMEEMRRATEVFGEVLKRGS